MALENLNNAWLSPSGRIVTKAEGFYAEYAWHEELGLCLLRDLWKLEDTHDAFERVHKKFSNSAIEELEAMGWLRLHGFGGITPVWILPLRREPTAKQAATIQDWCLANGRQYDSCFAK